MINSVAARFHGFFPTKHDFSAFVSRASKQEKTKVLKRSADRAIREQRAVVSRAKKRR